MLLYFTGTPGDFVHLFVHLEHKHVTHSSLLTSQHQTVGRHHGHISLSCPDLEC